MEEKITITVKELLIFIAILIALIVLAIHSSNLHKEAIERCVSSGNSRNYCVSSLQ